MVSMDIISIVIYSIFNPLLIVFVIFFIFYATGMELTLKKTKITFKQLDGTLRTMDKDTGKRISLSHKCGELDKQIPQLLGVSKSILEHVRCLFCLFVVLSFLF